MGGTFNGEKRVHNNNTYILPESDHSDIHMCIFLPHRECVHIGVTVLKIELCKETLFSLYAFLFHLSVFFIWPTKIFFRYFATFIFLSSRPYHRARGLIADNNTTAILHYKNERLSCFIDYFYIYVMLLSVLFQYPPSKKSILSSLNGLKNYLNCKKGHLRM